MLLQTKISVLEIGIVKNDEKDITQIFSSHHVNIVEKTSGKSPLWIGNLTFSLMAGVQSEKQSLLLKMVLIFEKLKKKHLTWSIQWRYKQNN